MKRLFCVGSSWHGPEAGGIPLAIIVLALLACPLRPGAAAEPTAGVKTVLRARIHRLEKRLEWLSRYEGVPEQGRTTVHTTVETAQRQLDAQSLTRDQARDLNARLARSGDISAHILDRVTHIRATRESVAAWSRPRGFGRQAYDALVLAMDDWMAQVADEHIDFAALSAVAYTMDQAVAAYEEVRILGQALAMALEEDVASLFPEQGFGTAYREALKPVWAEVQSLSENPAGRVEEARALLGRFDAVLADCHEVGFMRTVALRGLEEAETVSTQELSGFGVRYQQRVQELAAAVRTALDDPTATIDAVSRAHDAVMGGIARFRVAMTDYAKRATDIYKRSHPLAQIQGQGFARLYHERVRERRQLLARLRDDPRTAIATVERAIDALAAALDACRGVQHISSQPPVLPIRAAGTPAQAVVPAVADPRRELLVDVTVDDRSVSFPGRPALSFDHDGAMAVIDSTGLLDTEALTIAAWMRVERVRGDWQYLFHIHTKEDGNNVGQAALWGGLTDQNTICITLDSQAGDHRDGDTGIEPEIDTWYHVAATWDGAVVRVFVDGVERVSYERSKAVTGASPLRLGSHENGYRPLHAAMRDLRIWHAALTAEELARNMQNPPQEDATLVAWWPADESGAQRLRDAVGQRHGRLVSARLRPLGPARGYRLAQPVTMPDIRSVRGSSLDWNGRESAAVLSFDGDGLVEVPTLAGWELVNGSLTVEAWVWLPDIVNRPNRTIFYMTCPVGDGGVVLRQTRTGWRKNADFSADFRFRGRRNTARLHSKSGWREYGLRRWIHVAAVLDWKAKEARLYLNGELEATVERPSGRFDLYEPRLRIGGTMTGRIAEVRMWETARSQEDIVADHRRELRGNEPGLVGYWRLDDGRGDIAYDSGPSGHHGRIKGATWRHQTATRIGFSSGVDRLPERWLLASPGAAIPGLALEEDLSDRALWVRQDFEPLHPLRPMRSHGIRIRVD